MSEHPPTERAAGSSRRRTVVWASVAAGALLIAGAWTAVALRGEPEPIAAPAPTKAPEPPVEDPTPTPTPTPTEEPKAPAIPILAVTSSGDLVLLDAANGQEIRTITDGLFVRGDSIESVDIAPAGDYAYVNNRVGTVDEILQVRLADGAANTLVNGWDPSVDPTGLILAFGSREPSNEMSGQGLSILEFPSYLRHIPPRAGSMSPDEPLLLDEPVWSLDGGLLYVGHGYSEGFAILVVDPHATPTLEAATRLGPPLDGGTSSSQSWEKPDPMADGRLAVFVRAVGYEPPPESMHVAILDPGTGEVLKTVDTNGRWVHSLAAHPTETMLAVVFEDGTLAIWDGSTLRDVASGIEAVAW
jgi:hypothetical protein